MATFTHRPLPRKGNRETVPLAGNRLLVDLLYLAAAMLLFLLYRWALFGVKYVFVHGLYTGLNHHAFSASINSTHSSWYDMLDYYAYGGRCIP